MPPGAGRRKPATPCAASATTVSLNCKGEGKEKEKRGNVRNIPSSLFIPGMEYGSADTVMRGRDFLGGK